MFEEEKKPLQKAIVNRIREVLGNDFPKWRLVYVSAGSDWFNDGSEVYPVVDVGTASELGHETSYDNWDDCDYLSNNLHDLAPAISFAFGDGKNVMLTIARDSEEIGVEIGVTIRG
jgi:hypothetical protein